MLMRSLVMNPFSRDNIYGVKFSTYMRTGFTQHLGFRLENINICLIFSLIKGIKKQVLKNFPSPQISMCSLVIHCVSKTSGSILHLETLSMCSIIATTLQYLLDEGYIPN